MGLRRDPATPEPSPPAAPARAGSRRRRGVFTGTLLLAMTVGGLPQFLLGVLAPFLTAEFGLSRTELGSLTTATFIVGAVASPFAGRLVDRIGGRAALLTLFWLGIGGFGGLAAATGYWTVVLAVGVAGLPLALMNPVTNQLIAVHLPRGQQGVVTGVKQSGVQLGAFLTGALLPVTALAIGWRGAVLLVVVLPLLGLLATRFGVPRPARDGTRPARPRPRLPVGTFVRWLTAYAFLMGAGVAAVSAFLVLYAVEELGFSESRAGFVAALIGGAGVAARIVWGRAAERMVTSTAPLLVLAAGSVVAQVAVWGAAPVGPWLLWAGAAAFGATAGAWNAVGMLAIVREVEPASMGRASGVVQSGFYLGLLVCPILFGASVDVTGGYDLGWAGVTGAFAAATLVAARWHTRRR
jgi:predicted MFS family arabinose efflux permease